MKKLATGFMAVLLMLAFSLPTQAASAPKPIDSVEAYNMVMASPSDTFIVDVRTRAEYLFVGHPDLPNGVPNIPYKFYPSWEINKNFVQDVEARYKKTDTVITICRSGVRAEVAAKLLVEAGFEEVYYMTDSFEGAKTDEKGHRTVDGWKVNGLPYTYKLEDNLIYK